MTIGDDLVTGDLEAQQHPKWFVKHKELLRNPQVEAKNLFGFFILKVVGNRRQPPEAFTPIQFRFGLHNRETLAENLDILGPEGLKLSIARALKLGDRWDEFCDFVVHVDEINSVLACYGLQEGMTSWSADEIKHVLALDALFLAVAFDRLCKDWQLCPSIKASIPDDSNNAFHSSFKSHDAWIHDLFKVENQIPFILIPRVLEYFNDRAIVEINDQTYLDICMWYAEICTNCFMDITGEFFRDESNYLKKYTHILGASYEAICGHKHLRVDNSSVYENQYIHIPSASKLLASGIKIKGEAAPLCTVSYKNQCLSLPMMNIYDETISFIRNMAYYEEHFVKDGCFFHDYVALIRDLVKTPADLEVLVETKVIDNSCRGRAFQMLRSLDEGLSQIPSSAKYHEVKARIQQRCSRRRHGLWSEFQVQFCSKPWLVMSTIAITLVTVATLIQTYAAIIGSNRMKPQFGP